jgi:ribonuclease J
MRHMREQGRLGKASGIPKVVVQKNGEIVRLAPGKPGKLAEVQAGRMVLDGDIIVAADGEAITMRRRMARDGLLLVVIDAHGRPHVNGIGLPLDEDYAEFVEEAEADVAAALRKLKSTVRKDREAVKEAARLAARRAAQRWCGKKPQTRVLLAEEFA